mgnify:CR=1 FL=1
MYQFPFTGIYYDIDGTLTGQGAESYATFFYPHLDQPECTKDLDVYNGVVCTKAAQVRRIAFHGGTPGNLLKGMPLKILKFDATQEALGKAYIDDKNNYSQINQKDSGDPGSAWTAPFVTGHKYRISFG